MNDLLVRCVYRLALICVILMLTPFLLIAVPLDILWTAIRALGHARYFFVAEVSEYFKTAATCGKQVLAVAVEAFRRGQP